MKLQKYFDKQLKKMCWRIDLTIHGTRYRRGRFDTKAEAEAAIRQLQTRANQSLFGLPGKSPQYTLATLLQRRETDIRSKGQRQALRALRWLIEMKGAHTPIQSISRATLLEFRDHLAAQQNRRPSTIQQYLAYIGTALRAAVDYWPDLDWSPPVVPHLRIGPGRTRTLTTMEIAAILRELHAPRLRYESEKTARRRRCIADLFRFALLIPARRGELLALSTVAVNLDLKTVQIHATKTNNVRVLPLSPMAEGLLKRNWPEKGTQFFPFTEKQLVVALQGAAERAGIAYGDNVPGGWVFHDLRHTAASILNAASIDHSTMAHLLGHTLSGMTYRYIHSNAEMHIRGVMALQAFAERITGFNDGILTVTQRRIES